MNSINFPSKSKLFLLWERERDSRREENKHSNVYYYRGFNRDGFCSIKLTKKDPWWWKKRTNIWDDFKSIVNVLFRRMKSVTAVHVLQFQVHARFFSVFFSLHCLSHLICRGLVFGWRQSRVYFSLVYFIRLFSQSKNSAHYISFCLQFYSLEWSLPTVCMCHERRYSSKWIWNERKWLILKRWRWFENNKNRRKET